MSKYVEIKFNTPDEVLALARRVTYLNKEVYIPKNIKNLLYIDKIGNLKIKKI